MSDAGNDELGNQTNRDILSRLDDDLLARMNLSGSRTYEGTQSLDEEPPIDVTKLDYSVVGSQSVQPAADVPDDLTNIALGLDLQEYEVDLVSVEELRETSADPLAPQIPAWVSPSFSATKDASRTRFGPTIRYGDRQLTPSVVLGTDERSIYSDTSFPWGCICKIITSTGSSGSGIIVGPRHVLTASHVVNWGNNNGVNGTVEVHRAGPTVSAISPISRVHAFTRITGSTVGSTELDEDYAVVVTSDRIGDRFGWVGVRTYNSSWDDDPYWFNIGYPGDVGAASQPTWQRSKWLDEHSIDFGSGRAMDTNADINPGNSGGPMFAFWSDGPYVVAVVSAHDVGDRENFCSGGSDLTRLTRRAIELNP